MAMVWRLWSEISLMGRRLRSRSREILKRSRRGEAPDRSTKIDAFDRFLREFRARSAVAEEQETRER